MVFRTGYYYDKEKNYKLVIAISHYIKYPFEHIRLGVGPRSLLKGAIWGDSDFQLGCLSGASLWRPSMVDPEVA